MRKLIYKYFNLLKLNLEIFQNFQFFFNYLGYNLNIDFYFDLNIFVKDLFIQKNILKV